jgi:two-component system cell cycle response regulator DivK
MISDKKRVLVVEDDPLNLQMFREFLDAYGFDSVSAHDGEEGARKAVSCSPDMIIMDIQLPILDGFGSLRKIRASSAAHLPVIAVTAHFHDRETLIASGFDDFIPKPVDLELLNERLKFYSTK